MTRFELHGMIRDINDRAVAEKYEKKLLSAKNVINMTAEELVELDYYSNDVAERQLFLEKAKGQKVQVEKEPGVILISYNNNF